MSNDSEPAGGPHFQGPRLWEIRWVRDLGVLAVTLLVLHAIYAARAVTLPILVAFALAYIFNPLIEYGQKRLRLSRLMGTCLVLVAAGLVFLATLIVLGPLLFSQLSNLTEKVPAYIRDLLSLIHIDWNQLRTSALEIAHNQQAAGPDGQKLTGIAKFLINTLGVGAGMVTTAISFVTYLGMFLVITAFCFFFFSWKFGDFTHWFVQFIPESKKAQTLATIQKMDRAVAGFVRGRLVQSMIMATILTAGWWFFGVPYFLLLGMLCGMLNLIPYAASIGWLGALAVVLANQLTDGSGFAIMPLVWPTLVYFAAQLIDGWVVEPLVQGKATNLDPLSVLLAVLIGGVLAGLMGMLLAIPVAACIKILATDILIPNLRQYVQRIG